MADVEHQPRSSAEEPSPLYRLFASPEWFFSMCERHVLSRVDPTTIKFLTHTSREVRENVQKIRERVPKKFRLVECASREAIVLGWNALKREGWDTEELISMVYERGREKEYVHPLLWTHALGESNCERAELKRKLEDLTQTMDDSLNTCGCCGRTYHDEYIVHFDRGFLLPEDFGGDGKTRCESACGRCFEKYVPKGFGHPEVEEGNDDRDDWVARDFCECCDEYYHSENVTWIERGFKKNGKGQKLYSACSRCFDKYVLD